MKPLLSASPLSLPSGSLPRTGHPARLARFLRSQQTIAATLRISPLRAVGDEHQKQHSKRPGPAQDDLHRPDAGIQSQVRQREDLLSKSERVQRAVSYGSRRASGPCTWQHCLSLCVCLQSELDPGAGEEARRLPEIIFGDGHPLSAEQFRQYIQLLRNHGLNHAAERYAPPTCADMCRLKLTAFSELFPSICYCSARRSTST